MTSRSGSVYLICDNVQILSSELCPCSITIIHLLFLLGQEQLENATRGLGLGTVKFSLNKILFSGSYHLNSDVGEQGNALTNAPT